jgi:hypothetical protein
MIEGDLYRQGVCSPLLKCISRDEGQELIREIYSGICGSHLGPQALLGKKFVKVSIGRRQLRTQQNSCKNVTTVKGVQETRINLCH